MSKWKVIIPSKVVKKFEYGQQKIFFQLQDEVINQLRRKCSIGF